MSRHSKRKDANGEREFLAELSGWLGTELLRNLSQTRDGAADCTLLANLAIEIKRAEKLRAEWFVQAEAQAAELGVNRIQVLPWRSNRQLWRVMPVAEFAGFCRKDRTTFDPTTGNSLATTFSVK